MSQELLHEETQQEEDGVIEDLDSPPARLYKHGGVSDQVNGVDHGQQDVANHLRVGVIEEQDCQKDEQLPPQHEHKDVVPNVLLFLLSLFLA